MTFHETETATETATTTPEIVADKEESGLVDSGAIDLLGNGKVLKEVLVAGSGEMPEVGQEVTVHYTGTLLDGTQFDSSRERGDPFKFTLGVGQVIKGWDVGVKSMVRGERAKLTISPDFAYGASGSPPAIPPAAELVFDVELLDFHDKRKDKYQMSAEERLQQASADKEAGTEQFKLADFRAASRHYLDAVGLLDNVADWPEPLQPSGWQVFVSAALNLSMCYLKLRSWPECVVQCTCVLNQDADNVKALYRRGLARLEMAEATEAKADLLRVCQLDPKNTLARQAYQRAKDAEKEINDNSKQTFARMFK